MKSLTYLRSIISHKPTSRISRDQIITRIALSIVLGFLITYFFKLFIYDSHIGIRRFPDYGPTLFSGGQPAMLMYLYVVLVAASFLLGWLLTAPAIRMPLFDRMSESGYFLRPASAALLLMFVTVTITAITTGSVHTAHFRTALYLLAGLGFAAFLIRRSFIVNKLEVVVSTANSIFMFIFVAIVLFNLPKIPVLVEIFIQSGYKQAATALFVGMLIVAVGLGSFLTRLGSRSEWVRLSLILASIYIISIREAWIYWGLDAFHEGESFLTVNLLVNGPYKFLVDFFPVHGLGRNIFHSYFASIFSENNLYFYRVVKAITYPFIHVLIFAVLYRYTRKLTVPLAFFILSYLLGFMEELDIEPFFLIAFLLVPFTVEDTNNTVRKVAVGVTLFFASIYSFEYFILLNIAMAITFIHHFYIRMRLGKQPVPWMHIAFYGSSLLFLAALGSRFVIWLNVVRNALGKSPNLLERSLESPIDFSLTFFLISAFFAVFLLFHLANIVAFLRKHKHTSTKSMLIIIFSILSLMFFVRAFNRSDIGHVLYGYSVSIPIIIALTIRYRLITERTMVLISIALLIIIGVNYAKLNQLNMDVLRQRPNYDGRLAAKDVRPLQAFGAIQVPAGAITDSHMTAAELTGLQSLIHKGYSFFDMTNQPVLIYGAVKSPLLTDDIYTLFYNTYREQVGAIKRLKASEKTLILWSAGHWTETLDFTYPEYRLPILSNYLISAYPHTYRVGRFVIFSHQTLDAELGEGAIIREKYDLGFAPSRMGPYKQESVTTLLTNTINLTNFSQSKPDALLIEANAIGGGQITITLLQNGLTICEVVFKVPRGISKNFVRLSNLPAYVRSNPVEIKVLEGDAGTKIESINYLKLQPQ